MPLSFTDVSEVLNITHLARPSLDVVCRWMSYLRLRPEKRELFLECFWPSQLYSKQWLIHRLLTKYPNQKEIVIFGGWFGVFAQMIAVEFPDARIISIDVDPECALVGREICGTDSTIEFITSDMVLYTYDTIPTVVLNTSTEHLAQDTYDAWWDKVPKGTPFILQGNNLVSCYDHIRCSETLEDFRIDCRLGKDVILSELECGHFTRFMAEGVK